ncbi:MAG: phasin family protein [Rhodospirillales bacterium]
MTHCSNKDGPRLVHDAGTAGETKGATVRRESSAAADVPPSAGIAGWVGFASLNVEAMAMSRSILLRGARALGMASAGVVLMSLEQALAVPHGLARCRSAADWVGFQGKVLRLATGRMLGTAAMLSEMALQVADDAAVPLRRRIEATVGEVLRESAA